MLTARTGLSEHVRFQRGNALEMPFASESFDVVWTQHSSMNIADKARLYAEIRRVLRPSACICCSDQSSVGCFRI
jgi:ubiquinone/menaquinone biosynthesis C-methylase UbiE